MALRSCRTAAVVLSALLLLSRPAPAAWFIRGNPSGSGTLSLTDPILILSYLFTGGGTPPCLDAADADDDGRVEVNDAIFILNHLFLGGPPPTVRFGGCWFDTTPDELGCESHETCNPVGVFLAMQKSGSVNNGRSFPRIRQETLDALAQLSPQDQFGLVFFDAGLYRFPVSDEAAFATPEMTANAVAWINSTFLGHGTCAKPALLQLLSYAAQSTAKTKVVLHVANGLNTCPGKDVATYNAEILEEVRTRNTGGIPLHAVCVGFEGGVNAEWMEKLASQNGGTFVRVIP